MAPDLVVDELISLGAGCHDCPVGVPLDPELCRLPKSDALSSSAGSIKLQVLDYLHHWMLYFIWQREHCQHRRQLTRFNQCAYPSMTSSSKWFLYFKSHRWPQWKVYWSGHDILPTALLTKKLVKSKWRRTSKPKEAPALRNIDSCSEKNSLWGFNIPDLQFHVGFSRKKV